MAQAGGAGKTQVRVTIYNQTYTLVAENDPAETEEVAHIVHDLMCSVAARAGNLDSTRIAVLTGLHLADQLRTAERELARLRGAEQELESFRTTVSRRTRDIVELLDTALEPEDPESP